MPRLCCVPGCRSNYKNEPYTTVFKFPKEETRKKNWVEAINRANYSPSDTAVVCVNHFCESHVIREDVLKRADGTILTCKRHLPKLTKEAIPTIFRNLPTNLSKTVSKQFEGVGKLFTVAKDETTLKGGRKRTLQTLPHESGESRSVSTDGPPPKKHSPDGPPPKKHSPDGPPPKMHSHDRPLPKKQSPDGPTIKKHSPDGANPEEGFVKHHITAKSSVENTSTSVPCEKFERNNSVRDTSSISNYSNSDFCNSSEFNLKVTEREDLQPITQTNYCTVPFQNETTSSPSKELNYHGKELHSFFRLVGDKSVVKETLQGVVDNNKVPIAEKELTSNMKDQFCVLSELSSVHGCSSKDNLFSDMLTAQTSGNYLSDMEVGNDLLQTKTGNGSSDATSNKDFADNNSILNSDIANRKEVSIIHAINLMASPLEMNSSSEVTNNIIMRPINSSVKYPRCNIPNTSPNHENLKIVDCFSVESSNPEFKNKCNELLVSEKVHSSSGDHSNLDLLSERKNSSNTSISVTENELDKSTVHPPFSEVSYFDKISHSCKETSDELVVNATVPKVESLTEPEKMSETSSFHPYEKNELDLVLEIVPCGIPAPQTCRMSMEKSLNSTQDTEEQNLVGCKLKWESNAETILPSEKNSSDLGQEKSFPLIVNTLSELPQSEPVEGMRINKPGSVDVDDPSTEFKEENIDTNTSCSVDIANGKYCLVDNNLELVVDGRKIQFQFDIGDEVFTCPFCSAIALNKETVGPHMWGHTSDKELKCFFGCNDVFVSLKDMLKHLDGHKENEVYKCEVCNECFATEALIKNHVAIIHGPNQLHNRTATETVTGTYCDVGFPHDNVLKLHLEKHSFVEHSCSLCGIHFQSASELTRHAASHSIQRPYCCKLCSFTAHSRCELHFHLNEHRGPERPYRCPSCSEVCLNEARFVAHVLALHCDSNLTCVCCKRTDFTHGNKLMEHMRSHVAHGWVERKVPGLKLFLSLQVMASRNHEKVHDDNAITVLDCSNVRGQFTPDSYLLGDEDDLVCFEMDID